MPRSGTAPLEVPVLSQVLPMAPARSLAGLLHLLTRSLDRLACGVKPVVDLVGRTAREIVLGAA